MLALGTRLSLDILGDGSSGCLHVGNATLPFRCPGMAGNSSDASVTLRLATASPCCSNEPSQSRQGTGLVQSVMIVANPQDRNVVDRTSELTRWLLATPRNGLGVGVIVYVDQKLGNSQRFKDTLEFTTASKYQNMFKYWNRDLCRASPELFDLVVVLGGNGTVLYASSLFQGYVPPVIIFSVGSLSFLANYTFQLYRSTLYRVMGEMGRLACQRTRLTCTVLRRGATSPTESAGPDKNTIHEQFVVLNELKIGSEGSSHLQCLALYANGTLLTTVQADGVIFATATGSTAYNLAASGPLLHPSLPSIILNAISPHTLSFRATILPPDIVLTVLVPKGSRSAAYAYFDGKSKTELHQGDRVTIDTSAHAFPTIDDGDTTSHWFASLRALFSYNYRSATQGSYQPSRNLSLDSPMGKSFGDELREEDEHDEPWDIEFHATH